MNQEEYPQEIKCDNCHSQNISIENHTLTNGNNKIFWIGFKCYDCFFNIQLKMNNEEEFSHLSNILDKKLIKTIRGF